MSSFKFAVFSFKLGTSNLQSQAFGIWSEWPCPSCLTERVKPISIYRSQVCTFWLEKSSSPSDWTSQASMWSKGSSPHCLIERVTFSIWLDKSCLICPIQGAKLLISDRDSCICYLIGWAKPYLFDRNNHLCCLMEEVKSLLRDWRSLNAFALWS